MEGLPDEIWRRILEMGVEKSKLSYKDLCCVSISSTSLNRLSNEDTLWSYLLTLDFPESSNHQQSSSKPLQSPYKTLYKLKFERDRDRKLAAHRRAVLRIESQIAVHSANVIGLRHRLMEEKERMKATSEELANLEKIRTTSVALNVWQPGIVRDRQRQLVEQCIVPIVSRVTSVQLELRLCKKQIEVFDKAYRNEKKRLDATREKLRLMKYHPLRDNQLVGSSINQCNIQRKKLKQCSEGDSSVNCGDNSFLYSLLPQHALSFPCNGSNTRLLPDLLAEKMGLPMIPPFYSENGTIEGLINGLNFGSSQATIMNTGRLGFQALNQQLRQAFETLQMLQLQLGQEKAHEIVGSSIFYLSLGKDDYIHIFLRDLFGVRRKYGSGVFAHILVNQMTQVVKDLYNVNVRKIICMGIGPLGCTPRVLWENYNSSARAEVEVEVDGKYCVDEVNKLVVEYNAMLSERLNDLNSELYDAQIIFCDVYQATMEIITNPKQYGFSNVSQACCGLGRFGGMVGCLAEDMACNEPSTHVWWDFYNPTQAVNSLLADWTWSGQPFNICHPMSIQQMATLSS